jgi:S-formylglutathione hydrolase FrmB
MHLTDPRLPWILSALAFGVLVAVIIGWPRWRHPFARATSRGVAVLLMNGLVIAICFLLLNNAYVFYTSWSDVFGSGKRESANQYGGPAHDALEKTTSRGLGRLAGPVDYALPDPGRRMQQYVVRDAASSADMQVLVYLPAGYRPGSTRRYPVVVGLHGFPSVPQSFVHLNFLRTADTLTREHRMPPTIFVIPQINFPNTLDTECVNGPPGTPQTDTWLAGELPDWVVRHFHVKTQRQDWATFGYSFGGWCAAELTMRHPGIFAAAVSLEGYFRPEFGRIYVPLTGAALRPYDLIWMAAHNPPPVAVWVFASKQDKLSYPTSSRFIRSAKAPLSVNATIVPTGGHRSAVFEPYVARAFTWLARTLRTARG